MADAEGAVMRLYEDASLRGELRDTEAEKLLKWAETQTITLAQNTPDDTLFEQHFETLRQLIQEVNRVVGKRTMLSAEELQTRLNALMAQGQTLGAQAVGDQVQSLVEALPSLDDASALDRLTSVLAPAEGLSASSAPVEASFSAQAVPTEPAPSQEPTPAEGNPDETPLTLIGAPETPVGLLASGDETPVEAEPSAPAPAKTRATGALRGGTKRTEPPSLSGVSAKKTSDKPDEHQEKSNPFNSWNWFSSGETNSHDKAEDET